MVEKQSEPQTIDVLSWLSRATLDIIGLTGWYISVSGVEVLT